MYIRTKDGIYEVVTAERGSDNKLLYIISTSKTENTTDWVHEADVILQADTIEELCDEYVYVRNKPSLEKPLTSLIRDLSIIDKVRKKSNTTVYGCIWTDKGLIYVAKMNDGGDLELI